MDWESREPGGRSARKPGAAVAPQDDKTEMRVRGCNTGMHSAINVIFKFMNLVLRSTAPSAFYHRYRPRPSSPRERDESKVYADGRSCAKEAGLKIQWFVFLKLKRRQITTKRKKVVVSLQRPSEVPTKIQQTPSNNIRS